MDEENTENRLVLLSDRIKDVGELAEDTKKLIEEYKAKVVPYTVQIGFDQYTTHEVLAKLLPDGLDIPSAFETVGHIAHVNLREEHEPYKSIIGQIKTVVNKIGTIETKFRFFQMEIIAGEANTEVEVQEEGCAFKFDYAKVYWNSRLQFEHRRLVQAMGKGSKVCDLFCGVGPFTLPAAKRDCQVYANDLNPESVHWLQVNVVRNKVHKNVKVYNMDAREFVGRALRDLNETAIKEPGKEHPAHFDHFIMNLPASAHEFLDVFPKVAQEGLLTEGMIEHCTVHCYIFCKTDEDPAEKIESGLGHSINRDSALIKRVRDVAPNKEMFCVSFKLPLSILLNSKRPRISDVA